jgi:AcrR family transcriptional regulator
MLFHVARCRRPPVRANLESGILMGISERRAREKEVLRQSILNAASELILEEGYQSLSIRKLAERIEYSPSTIYLYFKDKADILSTICQEAFSELSEKLDDIYRDESDPRTALRQGLRYYIDWGLHHPNHYMVTFGTPWPPPIACEDAHAPSSSERAGLDCFAKLVVAVVCTGGVDVYSRPDQLPDCDEGRSALSVGATGATAERHGEQCDGGPGGRRAFAAAHRRIVAGVCLVRARSACVTLKPWTSPSRALRGSSAGV